MWEKNRFLDVSKCILTDAQVIFVTTRHKGRPANAFYHVNPLAASAGRVKKTLIITTTNKINKQNLKTHHDMNHKRFVVNIP